MWTHFDCLDADKTRVYFQRSESSPIKLSLHRDYNLFPCDPFFQIVPNALGRLASLSLRGTPEGLRAVTTHLSGPAPLLEKLSIFADPKEAPRRNPMLPPTLFSGDLSSLCELRLQSINTDLPWRDMLNLTSLMLVHTSPVPVVQLLDFFECAPHLNKVELRFAIPTSDARNGRLVSLGCLKRMTITGGAPSSSLLDHLLIPVGACLTLEVDLPGPPTEDRPPMFFDNLKNLANFTTIELSDGALDSHMEFSGPNGRVMMSPTASRVYTTHSMLESLARFDTSKTKQLDIINGALASRDPLYRALPLMKDLCTFALYRSTTPDVFIDALDPSLGVFVCPKLEALVIKHRDAINVKKVIGMVAARAYRGAKFKSVKIASWYRSTYTQQDVLELKKHAVYAECSRMIGGATDDSDHSDMGE